MYCNNCGAKLPDDTKYCTECGAKIEVEASTTNKVEDSLKNVAEKINLEDRVQDVSKGLSILGKKLSKGAAIASEKVSEGAAIASEKAKQVDTSKIDTLDFNLIASILVMLGGVLIIIASRVNILSASALGITSDAASLGDIEEAAATIVTVCGVLVIAAGALRKGWARYIALVITIFARFIFHADVDQVIDRANLYGITVNYKFGWYALKLAVFLVVVGAFLKLGVKLFKKFTNK